MLDKGTLLRYYKRLEVQQALLDHCADRETCVRYGDSFGKRPDVLRYPQDVLELAIQGVTSFHCSEERWSNPLNLFTGIQKREMDELRIGWDLILDIDCAFIEYSKAAADLIVQFLRYSDLKNYDIKFSGNKGFHIAVPFESFPERVHGIPTALLFPEAPRRIAQYIKETIAEELGRRILALEGGNFMAVAERTSCKLEELKHEKRSLGQLSVTLNVDPFLEIDTILLSSRHLYRAPYSLHEKSGLVSLPIDPDKILQFKREMADPAQLQTIRPFLERKGTAEGAKVLFLRAYDATTVQEKYEKKSEFSRDVEIPEKALGSECFPPCIHLLLKGLGDGRKRSLFVLINFLRSVGWTPEAITPYIQEWNSKNSPPLRDTIIQTQLQYHLTRKPMLPPNCARDGYYRAVGICRPDNWCRGITNPIQHAKNKEKYLLVQQAAVTDEPTKAKKSRKRSKDGKAQEAHPASTQKTGQPE